MMTTNALRRKYNEERLVRTSISLTEAGREFLRSLSTKHTRGNASAYIETLLAERVASDPRFPANTRASAMNLADMLAGRFAKRSPRT